MAEHQVEHQVEHHAHATTGTYLRIAAVLVIITLIEVGIFYVPTFQSALVPVLLFLSALKFTLVVAFYMHLKQDSRLFSGVFVFPIIIAAVIILSLVVLMAYHWAFAASGG